eukprot:10365230-Alexandrium_andersonii.AAC.1
MPLLHQGNYRILALGFDRQAKSVLRNGMGAAPQTILCLRRGYWLLQVRCADVADCPQGAVSKPCDDRPERACAW